jgi:hypothetical protein
VPAQVAVSAASADIRSSICGDLPYGLDIIYDDDDDDDDDDDNDDGRADEQYLPISFQKAWLYKFLF